MNSKNTTNSNIPNFPRKFVYFEKQSNDRLCGVHCLNALLQGPYCDPGMLAEIGLRLDEMENNLYQGNFKQHENVDDDGNYNVQVLQEALKIYGAEIQPLRSSDATKLIQKNINLIEAFIFNSSTHWFALRKIDNIWFNLNSTNVFPGPEIISDFYLDAFIQGTEQIGYTNFLVKNLPQLPPINSDIYKNLQNYQRLVSIEDIIKARDSKKLKEAPQGKEPEKPEEKKFNAFTGKGVSLCDSEVKNNIQSNQFEDDEMKQAYELSLDEYIKEIKSYLPNEPQENDPEVCNVILKYGDQTFSRRFKTTDKIYVRK
jgi:Ataxin-3